MKKLLFIISFLVILCGLQVALAAPTSTRTINLFIDAIKPSAGTSTLVIDSTGLVMTSTPPSGGGGGGGGSGSLTTTTPFTAGNLTLASTTSALSTYTGASCGNGTAVQVISASGTVSCVSVTASGGNGTVVTSSAVSNNQFPYWTAFNSLNGTSSLTFFPATGALNVSGTITSNGTGLVLNTRAVNTTGPWLTGGGDLSADRALSFINNGLLANASVTATAPILWSASNVISWGGLTTSSDLVAGQWIIANSKNQIYSTSSQPIITLNASGTNITVSGPSATGTAIIGIQSNPLFVNLTTTNVSSTNISASGYLQSQNIFDLNGNRFSTSTVTNALLLGATGPAITAYGGSGSCSAGYALSVISGTGVGTCIGVGLVTSTPYVANALLYTTTATGNAVNSTSGLSVLTDGTLSSTAARITSGTIGTLYDFQGNKYSTSTGGGSGTPGGSDTQIQFNDSSAFNGSAGLAWIKGTSNFSISTASTTFTAVPNQTSTAAVISFGAPIVGGNVSGTYIGINASSVYSGDFLNFQANSSTQFKVSATGSIVAIQARANQPQGSDVLQITRSDGSVGASDYAHFYLNGTQIAFTTPFFNTYDNSIGLQGGAMRMGNTTQLQWGAGGTYISGSDTAITRNTLGVLEIDNTTAGQYRDLIARNIGLGLAMTSNAMYSELTVGGLPVQSATSSLALLGSNFITSGNPSGTFLAANPTSSYNGDLVNLQVNSSTIFKVSNTKAYVAAGTSTFNALAAVGGAINFSVTSTGNGAGASTTLMSYNIPSSTYQKAGDEIDILVSGTFANTASTNKQVQIVVSSTVIFDSSAASGAIPANAAGNWFAQSRCTMITVTSTRCATEWTDSANSALTDDSGDAGNAVAVVAVNTSTPITVYGNGTNASDVVGNYFRVQWNPI